MKLERRLALPAILLLSVTSSAWAQGGAPQSSHDRAIIELLEVSRAQETMIGGATAMIDAQVQGNPAIAPFRQVMLDWTKKYLSWEAMRPELIAIYRQAFTEDEVRQLIAFNRTPVGQKALTKMPEITQASAAIGAKIAHEHTPELERMIEEHAKKLEAGLAKP